MVVEADVNVNALDGDADAVSIARIRSSPALVDIKARIDENGDDDVSALLVAVADICASVLVVILRSGVLVDTVILVYLQVPSANGKYLYRQVTQYFIFSTTAS